MGAAHVRDTHGCCYDVRAGCSDGLRCVAARKCSQLTADRLVVRLRVLTCLGRAPTSGHQPDERQEQDLTGEADPPPALPLTGRILLRFLNARGFLRQVGELRDDLRVLQARAVCADELERVGRNRIERSELRDGRSDCRAAGTEDDKVRRRHRSQCLELGRCCRCTDLQTGRDLADRLGLSGRIGRVGNQRRLGCRVERLGGGELVLELRAQRKDLADGSDRNAGDLAERLGQRGRVRRGTGRRSGERGLRGRRELLRRGELVLVLCGCRLRPWARSSGRPQRP